MKKRILASVLVLILALGLCMPAAAADIRTVDTSITYREIKIVINGALIAPCDETGASTEPFIMNDTTYLPVRAVAGALGLKVGWEPSTSTVVLERGGELIYGTPQPAAPAMSMDATITYRGTNISLDGENIPLVNRNGESVEPFIYKGSNYLPLRAVGEALGLSVDWNGITSTVTLTGNVDRDEEDAEPMVKPDTQILPGLISLSSDEFGAPGDYQSLYNLGFEYDELGRLSRIYTDNGAADFRVGYDEAGRLASLSVEGTKYGNKSYRWEYDEDGKLLASYDTVGLYDGYIRHTDSEGRIVKEENAVDGDYTAFNYSYNDDERSVTIEEVHGITPVSVVKNYYNEGGQLISTLKDGNRTNFGYDEDGRLSYKEYIAAERDGYTPLVEEYRYSYNDKGLLIKEEMKYAVEDYISKIISYEYNADDSLHYVKERLNSLVGYTDPLGINDRNVLVEDYMIKEHFYTYDGAGRLTRYEEKNSGHEYNWGAGQKYFYESDIRYVESYVYDSEGRLVKKFEKQEGAVMDEYFYEDVWNYDSEDRLILHTRRETKENFNYPSLIKHSWSYDEKGRLTSDIVDAQGSYSQNSGGWTCRYDKYDRLVEFSRTHSNGWIISDRYEYDEAGCLIKHEREDNGALTTTTFSYDEAGYPVIMESKNDYRTVVGEVSGVEIPYTDINFDLFLKLKEFE